MAVNTNIIPEKVNAFRVYLEGSEAVGVSSSITLPELVQKSSTITGAGVLGEIDSPTIGQFESIEQEVQFNTMDSSASSMLKLNGVVNLTFRAPLQSLNKSTGGYSFSGLRIVEQGRVKKLNLGTIESGEPQNVTVTVEVTVIAVYLNDEECFYLDKLNGKYRADGEDQFSEITSLL